MTAAARRASKLAHERGGVASSGRADVPERSPVKRANPAILRSTPGWILQQLQQGKRQPIYACKSHRRENHQESLRSTTRSSRGPFGNHRDDQPAELGGCRVYGTATSKIRSPWAWWTMWPKEQGSCFQAVPFRRHSGPSGANLFALGPTARPTAYGNGFRRKIGAALSSDYSVLLAEHFQPRTQDDLAAPGGVELMTLAATFSFEEGSTILSLER